jgi:aquaporin rerated protein, other eukaryote
MLGGIAAAGVVSALFPGPLSVQVSLGEGVSVVRGLFIEMFLTIQLVLVVVMLAAEKQRATFMAPLAIGFSLFIGHMTGKKASSSTPNSTRPDFSDWLIRGVLYRSWN